MTRQELDLALRDLLQPHSFHDYAPNGLQVEGAEQIERVVTGVSANMALIEAAITLEADAVVVHHGFFWKSEPRTLLGIRARRVARLLAGEISLFGYHLPLDAHPEVGNNAELLRAIGFAPRGTFEAGGEIDGWYGELDAPVDRSEVIDRLASACDRAPLPFLHGTSTIARVGVCTGGGAAWFEAAVAAGVDLFVTGEAAEWSAAQAREFGANFVAAGHHATERFGPKALAGWISNRFGIDARFVDVPNPV